MDQRTPTSSILNCKEQFREYLNHPTVVTSSVIYSNIKAANREESLHKNKGPYTVETNSNRFKIPHQTKQINQSSSPLPITAAPLSAASPRFTSSSHVQSKLKRVALCRRSGNRYVQQTVTANRRHH